MSISNISWEAQLDLTIVNSSVQEALKTKKLFRYQFKDSSSFVNILEKAISEYVGSDFALGVSSATNAIFLTLKALGVDSNSKVLIPAFTFTAVPSAVIQCGAEPVLIDITESYVIDLEDLKRKILSSKAQYLLLSHMRGHLCDMDEVVKICEESSIVLIEDAAHALGVTWKGKQAGTFGIAGIYSLQSYKIINAGEGGVLVTNNPDVFWKSVFMSGSYENNYKLHSSKSNDIAKRYKNHLPVFNVRMNNITASLAIPQIKNIEATIDHINKNYNNLRKHLLERKEIELPKENLTIRSVRDSAQMRIKLNQNSLENLKSELNDINIPISYFGGLNNSNARLYQNWAFLENRNHILPNTKKNLSEVFDLRLPIHFQSKDIDIIAKSFLQVFDKVKGQKNSFS